MIGKYRYLNRRDTWLMLLAIPIVLPSGLISYWGISHIVVYAKALALAVLLLVYTAERIRMDRYTFFVFLFVAILIISTILNRGSIEKCFTTILNILCPVLWCRVSFGKLRIYRILNKLVFILFLISIIDIIIYWIYPMGIFISHTGELFVRSGIISNDNSIAPYLIPSCILTLFMMSKNGKDSILNTAFTFAIFLYAIFFVNTGVGMLISLLCVVFYYLYRFSTKCVDIFTPGRVGLSLLVIFLVVCVFGATGWLNNLAVYFGSTSEFSGRTKLWLYVIPMILRKPILGYGVLEDTYLVGYSFKTTAHNMYFQILLWAGIVGLIPIVLAFLNSIRVANNNWNNKNMRTLFVGATCILIYYMFEVHLFVPVFWIIVSLMNYYDLIIDTDITLQEE